MSNYENEAGDSVGDAPANLEPLDDFVRRTQGLGIPDELIEIEDAYANADSWVGKCCKSYAERFLYLQNRILEIRDLILSKLPNGK